MFEHPNPELTLLCHKEISNTLHNMHSQHTVWFPNLPSHFPAHLQCAPIPPPQCSCLMHFSEDLLPYAICFNVGHASKPVVCISTLHQCLEYERLTIWYFLKIVLKEHGWVKYESWIYYLIDCDYLSSAIATTYTYFNHLLHKPELWSIKLNLMTATSNSRPLQSLGG